MPRFKVRLESPDMHRPGGSPHCRVSSIVCDDEATAREVLERREFESCAYQLDADTLAKHTEKVAAGGASSTVRGQLHTHHQCKPYVIVSVEQVS